MSKADKIKKYVEYKVEYLMKNAETGGGKSAFANLRKGLGHRPGDLPDLWGELLLNMPEEFFGKDGNPSKEEWACYLAITLFSLHQQGNDVVSQPMHKSEMGLGQASYLLAQQENDENSSERVIRRLKSLATSKDIDEVGYHLRQIVQLLKQKKIPLDYGILARDLYLCQFDETSSQVYLKWGQDYYRQKNRDEKQKEASNEQ